MVRSQEAAQCRQHHATLHLVAIIIPRDVGGETCAVSWDRIHTRPVYFVSNSGTTGRFSMRKNVLLICSQFPHILKHYKNKFRTVLVGL